MRCWRFVAFTTLMLVAIGACQKASRAPQAHSEAAQVAQSVAAARAEGKQQDANPMPRKIIRDLDVSMAVPDADPFLRAVEKVVAQAGGYVSDKQVSHDGGRIVGGTVTLRVPSEKLDGAGEALHAMGTIESESLKAEDISEQYYDLASRLANARHLEERLLKLLEERPGSLADVVALESKLAEVREQIEKLEGKQRLWDNQVALSTIRLAFRVASPVAEASYLGELGETLRQSALSIVSFGRGLSFVVVALLPWIPLALIGVLLWRWALRRRPVVAPKESP